MAREFGDYWQEAQADPQELMEAYRAVQAAAERLMHDRQSKYGSSNIAEFGLHGIVVRSTDKLKRLRTMVWEGQDDAEESIADSLCDLLNYATIGLMLHLTNADGVSLWELPFDRHAHTEEVGIVKSLI